MTDTQLSRASISDETWTCSACCRRIPKDEVVYFCQVVLIYIIAFACLFNLSFGDKEYHSIWWSLLSGSVGYLLPSPRIGKPKNESIPTDTAQ
jgi:hypothetical protein